ncbi:MAG: zf-HC2 domain-containing protein [Gaiellaceae bacterium]
MSFSATECARVRESISAQLDGELPEHELDSLEMHVSVCPACSAWAEEVQDLTRRLREASLEAPADRFALPRHGRSWRVSSAVALASAAAVVATMFFSPSGNRASQHATSGVTLSASTARFSTPRLVRLGDGRFAAISVANSTDLRFRPV